MGLYNVLHGENADAGKLLMGLGFTKDSFARYRDCWISDDDLIAVYTRLGGGNSECWCDEGEEHYCYVAAIAALRNHPRFVRDQDDDFDSTYKTFYFQPPDAIPQDYPRGASGDERWAATLEALGKADDPRHGPRR